MPIFWSRIRTELREGLSCIIRAVGKLGANKTNLNSINWFKEERRREKRGPRVPWMFALDAKIRHDYFMTVSLSIFRKCCSAHFLFLSARSAHRSVCVCNKRLVFLARSLRLNIFRTPEHQQDRDPHTHSAKHFWSSDARTKYMGQNVNGC